MPDPTKMISAMERREARKAAATAAVQKSRDEEAALSEKLAEVKKAAPIAPKTPTLTKNERKRVAREAAAAQATAEEQRIVSNVKFDRPAPGSTNMSLAQLNAEARATHAGLAEEARDIANALGKAAYNELLRPDRQRHTRHKRARQVADMMRQS
jgi:hypothetical protein